jgi:hypothetical protein
VILATLSAIGNCLDLPYYPVWLIAAKLPAADPYLQPGDECEEEVGRGGNGYPEDRCIR